MYSVNTSIFFFSYTDIVLLNKLIEKIRQGLIRAFGGCVFLIGHKVHTYPIGVFRVRTARAAAAHVSAHHPYRSVTRCRKSLSDQNPASL